MVLLLFPSPSFSFLSFLLPLERREKKEPKKREERYTLLTILSYLILSHPFFSVRFCSCRRLLTRPRGQTERTTENQTRRGFLGKIAYQWCIPKIRIEVRKLSRLTKYEQETIINFNVAEHDAVVFTRDKATMKKLDALVAKFPEVYKCIGETDIDKTYSIPKEYVSYRKPRKLSEETKKQRREMMKNINFRG